MICGSVDIKTVYVGSRQAKAAVISRLSSERAGTRLFKFKFKDQLKRSKVKMLCRFQVRGVDDGGSVANFVESEQLISIGEESTATSFVQVTSLPRQQVLMQHLRKIFACGRY